MLHHGQGLTLKARSKMLQEGARAHIVEVEFKVKSNCQASSTTVQRRYSHHASRRVGLGGGIVVWPAHMAWQISTGRGVKFKFKQKPIFTIVYFQVCD